MIHVVDTQMTGETSGEAREYLADSRVRAVLLRPGPDLVWSSNVVRPMSGALESSDDRVFGDGAQWLVSAAPPTATFARNLGPVIRAFERLAQRPAPDAIYAFVQTFGWLGHLESLQVVRSEPGVRALHVGGSSLAGEALSWWLAELASFSGVREMWRATVNLVKRVPLERPDLLADRETAARSYLRECVTIGDEAILYRLPISPPEHAPWQAWESVAVPGLERRMPKGDLAAAGSFVVCHVINERLRGHAHPTLMPFQERAMAQVPDCLLGAIYLRLATEVSTMSKNPKSKQCPVCQTTFDGNGNSVYCGDPCKWKKKYLVESGRWPID
jgi:hypothetical protein